MRIVLLGLLLLMQTPPPLATFKGTGDDVITVPTSVKKVHIVATTPGRLAIFTVYVGPTGAPCGVKPTLECHLIVNAVLGTAQTPPTYEGTVLTGGEPQVSIKANGVTWTISEVR